MTKYWRFKEPLEEPPNVSAGVGAGDAACLRLPSGTLIWTSREALEEVQAPLPDEPSDGSVVVDSDGDIWQRRGDHWGNIQGGSFPWSAVQGYAPLVPMIRGPSIEELEFWLQRIAPGSSDAAHSLLAYLKADR